MSILNDFSDWKQARYEKFKAEMESLGRCPECRGRGFTSSMPSIYIPSYDSIFDCPGCNGSGNFNDWNINNQQIN